MVLEERVWGGDLATWFLTAPYLKVAALFVGFMCGVIVAGVIARVMQK